MSACCHINLTTRYLRFKIKIRVYQRAIFLLTLLVSFLITGEGDDYLTVSLRDGGAAVGMTLAKGRLDLHIKPARVRFDDNQWHKIVVHRKVQEVIIIFLNYFIHTANSNEQYSLSHTYNNESLFVEHFVIFAITKKYIA